MVCGGSRVDHGPPYIVYGPLLLGATSFMYEGCAHVSLPEPLVEHGGKVRDQRDVHGAHGAPRLMRFGEAWPNRHDLSSLRLLGSVGEPINPEAWRWYHHVIGKERCPIMDTWWQTKQACL